MNMYKRERPRWLSGKESACQRRRHRFNLQVRKILWSRKLQLTPVFLPGKSYGQRSLAGYRLAGVTKDWIRLSNREWARCIGNQIFKSYIRISTIVMFCWNEWLLFSSLYIWFIFQHCNLDTYYSYTRKTCLKSVKFWMETDQYW